MFTTSTLGAAARSVFSTNTKDIYLPRFVKQHISFFIKCNDFFFHFCFSFPVEASSEMAICNNCSPLESYEATKCEMKIK